MLWTPSVKKISQKNVQFQWYTLIYIIKHHSDISAIYWKMFKLNVCSKLSNS